MRTPFLFLLPLALLASCSGNENSSKQNTDTMSVQQPDSTSDWHELTEAWTASLNLKNASIMKSFYADSVVYYGDRISSNDVVSRQTAYFNANSDYHQKISEYLGEEQQPDGSWRVRITKEVTAGGKTASYPASLVFMKDGGIWKIVSESDDITDINKARLQQVKYDKEVVTVEGLLEETTGFNTSDQSGDPKSNGAEKYFVVWPSSKLDVIATPEQEKEGVTITEHNVDRLQLSGDEKMITPLLNKKVRVKGTLFHQHTAHHFTKVLIEVQSIEAVK